MSDSKRIAVSPEALLAEGRWLRRLAQALHGEDADDLVQETYLAALRAPPADDRPLRPWLGRVLRNFVYMRHRGGARAARLTERLGHEPDEGLPSPEALLAQHEAQRLVAAAVSALEEPFRSTVLLCYAEGKTPAEIAEHLGIPGATVRSRLKRGRDDLRARLTAEAGASGKSLRALLLPLAGAERSRPQTAPGLSAWRIPWLLAAGPTVLVGAALLWPSDRPAPRPSAEPPPAAVAARPAASSPPATQTPRPGGPPMNNERSKLDPKSARTVSLALAALTAAALAGGPAAAEAPELSPEEAMAQCLLIREKIIPCAGEYAAQAVEQHLAQTGKKVSDEDRKKMEAKVLERTNAEGTGPLAGRRVHCEKMLKQIQKGGARLTRAAADSHLACFQAEGCRAQMACVFAESAKLLPAPKSAH